MFRYNPKANYQPNGGRYLHILSGKDLYKQTIVVSNRDTFPVRFPNIFVDYPLGQMHVGDRMWTNWNKAPMRLWQIQLNFAVWCASSACGVSSVHLNYTKHPMIRLVYRFHVYYHVSRVLKKLQTPLPHETSFNAADNPLTVQSAFLNNFENVVNRRVDIREDIKRYQDTLSHASSKVNCNVRKNLFMLPSDMKLKIKTGTVRYNNKILISNGNFSLGKNENVNSLEIPAIKNHKTNSLETPAIESHSNTTQGLTHTPIISHENEKAALILFIIGGFTVWFLFQ